MQHTATTLLAPSNSLHGSMFKGVVCSPCQQYRYALWRVWNSHAPQVLFIGLNPSAATEGEDDPTLRKCVQYAQAWGFGGLAMANLFAWRSTDPQQLLGTPQPIGPENDAWLAKLSQRANLVVAAWGNHGQWHQRAAQVAPHLPPLHCLKRNKNGQPAHPLYLNPSLQPTPYN
jgi:hypothetical protein